MADVYSCEVLYNKRLADRVFEVAASCGELASAARPGQFLHIRCGALPLRRPISVCRVRGDAVSLVFEVKGEGTRFLSGAAPGDFLDALGPLGNGFGEQKGDVLLVGGGMGVPPLLFAAESAKGSTALLGFRDAGKVILIDEFEAACGHVRVATDDGSFGAGGSVAGLLGDELARRSYSIVLACGPTAMLRSVAGICGRAGVPCRVSLEERMGCGVGACLVCACEMSGGGAMARVCRDGPVFDGKLIANSE